MQRLFLSIAISGLFGANLFAQADVALVTGTSHPVYYNTSGNSADDVLFPVGSPASLSGYGQLNVAIYTAAEGTELTALGSSGAGIPDLSNWKISQNIVHSIAPLPGVVPSTVFKTDSLFAGGTVLATEVVAWTGNYGSFEDALQAASTGANVLLGWSGSDLSGGSFGFDQLYGTTMTPQVVTTGSNGYNSLVLAPLPDAVSGSINTVPEPGSLALAALGAAALMSLRRRR